MVGMLIINNIGLFVLLILALLWIMKLSQDLRTETSNAKHWGDQYQKVLTNNCNLEDETDALKLAIDTLKEENATLRNGESWSVINGPKWPEIVLTDWKENCTYDFLKPFIGWTLHLGNDILETIIVVTPTRIDTDNNSYTYEELAVEIEKITI